MILVAKYDSLQSVGISEGDEFEILNEFVNQQGKKKEKIFISNITKKEKRELSAEFVDLVFGVLDHVSYEKPYPKYSSADMAMFIEFYEKNYQVFADKDSSPEDVVKVFDDFLMFEKKSKEKENK